MDGHCNIFEAKVMKKSYIFLSTSFAVHCFCTTWCHCNKNTERTLWTHGLSNVDPTAGAGPWVVNLYSIGVVLTDFHH